MRVLVAHKCFYRGGGTATYLFGLIDELERRGHDWVPFTVAYEQTEVDRYSHYFVSPPVGAEQTHQKHMKLSLLAMLKVLKVLSRTTFSSEAPQGLRTQRRTKRLGQTVMNPAC